MKLKNKKIPAEAGRILIHFGAFCGVLLSGYLMMVLFATIPNAAIRDNMLSSAQYMASSDRYAVPENGQYRQIADNYADGIWLNIGWHMGKGDPFLSVLDTGYYDGEIFGTGAGLLQSVAADVSPNQSYTRYWHGPAALLRFLHLFTDIQGARTAGMVLLAVLVFLTVRSLFHRGHGDPAMCLLAALIAVQPWNLRLSFEYLPCFLVCFGLCPAFLKWEKQGDCGLTVLSVTAGAMTAFFDFLTVETITILVPLILVVTVRSLDGRLISKEDTARLLLKCLLCWGLAYGGTFLAKWAAVSFATGTNHFAPSLTSAGVRVDGTVVIGNTFRKPTALLGISANLSVLFGGTSRTSYGTIGAGLFLCGLILFLVYRELRHRRSLSRGTFFLIGLGSVVFFRFALLANHSYLHAFFTYRALLSPILAGLSALMLNLRPGKKKGRVQKWN